MDLQMALAITPLAQSMVCGFVVVFSRSLRYAFIETVPLASVFPREIINHSNELVGLSLDSF